MQIKTAILISVYISIAGLLANCSPNNLDEEIPSILWQTPENSSTILSAEGIPLHLQVTDDVQLQALKVMFEPIKDVGITSNWFYTSEMFINGQFTEVDVNIPIPDTIFAGKYMLSINALDFAENTTPVLSRQVEIKNSADTQIPILNISTPLPNDTTSIFSGSSLVFIGNGSDNKTIKGATVFIYNEVGELVNQYQRNTLQGESAGQIIEVFQAPPQEGIYTIYFNLYDSLHNYAQLKFIVKVV